MLRYSVWMFILSTLVSCSGPKAAFQIVNDDYKVPTIVSFENDSKNAQYYKWDFGDNQQSSEVSPKHNYLMSGRYTVSLSATKGNKVSVATKEIIMTAPEDCFVTIHTSKGDMIAKLYSDTPLHQDNFIKLAEEGYYDGLLFHRVIKGFMIQTGDPESREAAKGRELGKGGPDYTIEHEIKDTLLHIKGALAAARQSDEVNPQKVSSGSQFYIVQGRAMTPVEIENNEYEKGISYTNDIKELYRIQGGTPNLDMEYTVFGQIISGLEVIDEIAESKTDHRNRPHEDVMILKITVIK